MAFIKHPSNKDLYKHPPIAIIGDWGILLVFSEICFKLSAKIIRHFCYQAYPLKAFELEYRPRRPTARAATSISRQLEPWLGFQADTAVFRFIFYKAPCIWVETTPCNRSGLPHGCGRNRRYIWKDQILPHKYFLPWFLDRHISRNG